MSHQVAMPPLRRGSRRTTGFAMLCAAGIMLAGCAGNPYTERAQFTAPTMVGHIYSDAQLRMRLVVSSDEVLQCIEPTCLEYALFDVRVATLGAHLSEIALRLYPDLAKRMAGFDFVVLDKAEPGTASTARGLIVVMRSVRRLVSNDEALSFVLAREMGHVIARHHEESAGTSILVSVLSTLLLPVATVVKTLGTVFATTVSPVAASASVTAVSLAGSRALSAAYRPRQRDDADDISLRLLSAQGIGASALVEAFSGSAIDPAGERWVEELQASIDRVALIAGREEAARRYSRELGRGMQMSTDIGSGVTRRELPGTPAVGDTR